MRRSQIPKYRSADDVADLAGRLGLGERHLRSLFIEHVGVAPKSLANTQRLDFARSLIDTTDLSMSDLALTAGFASLRRFNDAIKGRYKATPSALRKSVGPDASAKEPGKNTTTNFRISCIGCHVPARETDWVFKRGYTGLRKKGS